jgi:hypothetical protein
MKDSWKLYETAPIGEVVMTKIDDAGGCRNGAPLKRYGGLWWTPDGSMYVYYRPTHWRPLTPQEAVEIKRKLDAKAKELEAEGARLRAVTVRGTL